MYLDVLGTPAGSRATEKTRSGALHNQLARIIERFTILPSKSPQSMDLHTGHIYLYIYIFIGDVYGIHEW